MFCHSSWRFTIFWQKTRNWGRVTVTGRGLQRGIFIAWVFIIQGFFRFFEGSVWLLGWISADDGY